MLDRRTFKVVDDGERRKANGDVQYPPACVIQSETLVVLLIRLILLLSLYA
jgi:hypothetical protein